MIKLKTWEALKIGGKHAKFLPIGRKRPSVADNILRVPLCKL